MAKKDAGERAQQKNKNGILLIITLIVIVCLLVVILVTRKDPATTSDADISADISTEVSTEISTETPTETSTEVSAGVQETEQESDDVTVIAEGASLIIPIDEVTDDVSFFPVEVDGTRLEVIAVKDSTGNIRTAFNTCQVCYGSGRGYYVQQGNMLVCQNCGNRFTTDQVEIESGGCNPWPIFETDKIVTDDTIEISYDFLAESKDIFNNWKTNY